MVKKLYSENATGFNKSPRNAEIGLARRGISVGMVMRHENPPSTIARSFAKDFTRMDGCFRDRPLRDVDWRAYRMELRVNWQNE